MQYTPAPQIKPPPVLVYKARHERQEDVEDAWGKCKLLVLTGPAGSGKTSAPIFLALQMLLSKKIDKIMVGRPAVTVGEEHGFLPGTLEEKLGPWLYAFEDIVGQKNWREYRAVLNIEPVAVGMSRGRTVKKAVMLIDEAQNLTRTQLRLLASRVGSGGKLILCGDPEQSDLRGDVALESFCERMQGVRGFKEIRFLDEDVISCRGQFAADVNGALRGW